MDKRALVIGATGLVGKELVGQLLEDPAYRSVAVIVRRELSFRHPDLQVVLVEDLGQMGDRPQAFAADAVFCCLGTTIKTAGSREAFRQVDLDYPVLAARLALQAGARQFAVISSMGASEGSPIFYSRVKGELERRLRELGLPALHIVRPSLLLGHREEKRRGEIAAAAVSRALPFIWTGPLRKYRPIQAAEVAAAMREAVRLGHAGANIYESAELARLAGQAVPPLLHRDG